MLVNEQTPVYPGDPKVKIQPAGVFDNDGYNDHLLSIGTHIGTHIDAPLHMVKDGKALDKISIDKFVGRGKYVKVDGEFTIDSVESAGVDEGDIVLFHTGMSDQYYGSSYFEDFPAMTIEVAEYLIKKKVKMVGLDTGSADSKDGFPIHKALLGSGVLIIENLTNLDELAGNEFMVYALPLNLDIDGAPARVIAVIN